MNLNHLKKSQSFFLEIVHSNPSIPIQEILEKNDVRIFDNKTVHRLQAYRTSYYARISSVFTETVFKYACILFGDNIIKDFLVQYFYLNPNSKDMIESVREFPNFLDQQEEIQDCPFVPDFIRLCISINDILSAENPVESCIIKNTTIVPKPDEIYLQKDHFILESEWPVFQMYCAAKELSDLSESQSTCKEQLELIREEKLTSLKNESEAILIFKSCEWALEAILIPNEFITITKGLAKNYCLEEAIEKAEIDDENFDITKFSEWMSVMTKHSAFIKKMNLETTE